MRLPGSHSPFYTHENWAEVAEVKEFDDFVEDPWSVLSWVEADAWETLPEVRDHAH